MSAFRTKIREALGLPLDIEEEGGAAGGGTSGGSAGGGTGGTAGANGTGSAGSGDAGGTDGGMTDGGTDGDMDGDNGTEKPSIGHGFPLGWWRMGSYHKDKCPDGKHRDPKTGNCKKK